MKEVVIVVVGYNRPDSLSRLLSSLLKAEYDGDSVTLVISIDKSDNLNVAKVAQDFKWTHGQKIVNLHPQRLGLRNHIIICGNLALKYGSVIILEDDLYVSPNFYIYAKCAIDMYRNEDRVAGISLYSHLWNVNCSRPFTPADDGFDTYFLQFAQSWGQIWTNAMWRGFMLWYERNSEKIYDEPDMPDAVISWPDTSWVKYYVRYLVKTERFFVYPRVSLTSNFGDKGQHAQMASSSYQVPLLTSVKREYKFPAFNKEGVYYDVFFERLGLGEFLGIPESDLCVDLYTTKGNQQRRRYWLTMAKAAYPVKSSYGLRMRPHEVNIVSNIAGNDFHCYDTQNDFTGSQAGYIGHETRIKRIAYELRDTKREDIWLYSWILFLRRLQRIVKKFPSIPCRKSGL